MSAKLIMSMCSWSISLRSILILSSLLSLGLPSSPFPSCHRMKNLYTVPLFTTRTTLARVKEDEMDSTCGTRAVHLILLNFITSITSGDWYKSWSSSVHEFLQSPVTSSLDPHISLPEHAHLTFFPECETPSTIYIQNNTHSRNSVYFTVHSLTEHQKHREKFLNQTVADIPCILLRIFCISVG
jgi:hypothetical protein